MKTTILLALLIAAFAAVAPLHAQQLDIFDPDDFVDPYLTRGRVIFVSRLVAGASHGYLDQYRPAQEDVGFVHLSNTLYWSAFQFDVKHSELRDINVESERQPNPPIGTNVTPLQQDQAARRRAACGPDRCGDVDLNAPFDPNAPIEIAPESGSKTLVQVSLYQSFGDRAAFRYRAAYARQDATAQFSQAGDPENYDTTSMFQLDASLRVGGRRLFGTIAYTKLTRESLVVPTTQETLLVGTTLPLLRIGSAVLTPRIRVGAISDTEPALDLVNPTLDLSWRAPHTGGATLHIVYSPVYRTLAEGQHEVHHQIAVYVDRALFVFALGGRR